VLRSISPASLSAAMSWETAGPDTPVRRAISEPPARAVLPRAVTDTASFHEPFFGSLIVNVPRPALTLIVFLTAF
jgi:hypothetical protein